MRGVRYRPGAAEGDLHRSLVFLSYPCSSGREGWPLLPQQMGFWLQHHSCSPESGGGCRDDIDPGGRRGLPFKIMIAIMHTSNQDIKRWREKGLSGFNLQFLAPSLARQAAFQKPSSKLLQLPLKTPLITEAIYFASSAGFFRSLRDTDTQVAHTRRSFPWHLQPLSQPICPGTASWAFQATPCTKASLFCGALWTGPGDKHIPLGVYTRLSPRP